MTAPALPKKPAGKIYAIVLRRGYSAGRSFVAGAFGGKQDFPFPDLGTTQCVCCNAPTEGRVMPLDVSTDRWKADPVPTPVCPACSDHALAHVGSEIAIAMLFCVGLGGSLWGFAEGVTALGVAGLVLLLICVFWMKKREQRRVERTNGGHFPGFQLLIHPGQCVVRTSNRRLAQEIVEKSGSMVHRVR